MEKTKTLTPSELDQLSLKELIKLFHKVRRQILDPKTNKNTKVRLNYYLIQINYAIARKRKGY